MQPAGKTLSYCAYLAALGWHPLLYLLSSCWECCKPVYFVGKVGFCNRVVKVPGILQKVCLFRHLLCRARLESDRKICFNCMNKHLSATCICFEEYCIDWNHLLSRGLDVLKSRHLLYSMRLCLTPDAEKTLILAQIMLR